MCGPNACPHVRSVYKNLCCYRIVSTLLPSRGATPREHFVQSRGHNHDCVCLLCLNPPRLSTYNITQEGTGIRAVRSRSLCLQRLLDLSEQLRVASKLRFLDSLLYLYTVLCLMSSCCAYRAVTRCAMVYAIFVTFLYVLGRKDKRASFCTSTRIRCYDCQ